MNTECHTPFEWFMQMYMYNKTWMEGTYDIPNKIHNVHVNNFQNLLDFKIIIEVLILLGCCKLLLHVKVAATSLHLEIRLHAHPVGTNK